MKLLHAASYLVLIILTSCSTASQFRNPSTSSGVSIKFYGMESLLFSTTLAAENKESLIALTRRATQDKTTLTVQGTGKFEVIESMFDLGNRAENRKKYGWCFAINENDKDEANPGAGAITFTPNSNDKVVWYYGWVFDTIVEDATAQCTPSADEALLDL